MAKKASKHEDMRVPSESEVPDEELVQRVRDGSLAILNLREFQQAHASKLADLPALVLKELDGLVQSSGEKEGLTVTEVYEACRKHLKTSLSSVSEQITRLHKERMVDKLLASDRPRSVLVRIRPEGMDYLRQQDSWFKERIAVYKEAAGTPERFRVFAEVMGNVARVIEQRLSQVRVKEDGSMQEGGRQEQQTEE